MTQQRVAGQAAVIHALACTLPLAGFTDTTLNRDGGFGRRITKQVTCRLTPDTDLHIDAIEQGTGYAIAIVLPLHDAAMAAPLRIIGVAAGARIHGCHELEGRGVANLAA